jgi:hypothetical protein
MDWGEFWGGILDGPLVDQAQVRVWEQFKGPLRPHFQNLVTIESRAFQRVDDANPGVIASFDIDQAEGVVLDEFGAFVVQPRSGLADDDYRRAIKAKARSIISSGTINDFLEVLAELFPDIVGGVDLIELFPAAFCVYVPGLTETEENLLAGLFRDMPGAGIGRCIISFVAGQAFQWGSENVSITVLKHWDSENVAITNAAGFAHVVPF